MCDTVHVEFPELGVSATAKCVKTTYDVLADKYKKIELGSIKNSLANTLSEQSKTLSDTTSKSYVDNLIEESVDVISGNSGGYVVIHSSKGEKHPDEILIMDEPEIEKAKRIWRWNMSGLCYTDNYYSSFQKNDKKNKGIAITMDGKIVADFIAGNMIQGVGLQTAPDSNGEIWFQVTQNGTLTARKGIIGGCEIQNGILKIKNANIEETLEGHIIKASSIEGSEFRSTPIEILNESGEKELKSLFEVTKEGQVYIRSEAIVNKLKVDQLETEKFILSGVKYGEGSFLDIGTDEDSDLDAFRLSNSNGLLEARNAIIRGTIYSNSGNIAGLIMEKQISEYDRNQKSKVLRTNDDVFEIRVSSFGSSIAIKEINSDKGTFNQSITTSTLNVGPINISGKLININGVSLINLEYAPSDTTVTATLSCSPMTQEVQLKLTSNGSPYKLKNAKTFNIQLHVVWGGWVSDSITVGANEGDTSKNCSHFAVLGYDQCYFSESGSSTLTFTDSADKYIDVARSISPWSKDRYNLGSADFKWKEIYAVDVYTDSGEVKVSDKNEKKDIKDLSDNYDRLFNNLRPVSYKLIKNTSNRSHIGFIAQEVNEAIINAGLTAKDFAGYCKIVSGSKATYGLRYSEFIALNTYEIQKLKKRVKELEKKIAGI